MSSSYRCKKHRCRKRDCSRNRFCRKVEKCLERQPAGPAYSLITDNQPITLAPAVITTIPISAFGVTNLDQWAVRSDNTIEFLGDPLQDPAPAEVGLGINLCAMEDPDAPALNVLGTVEVLNSLGTVIQSFRITGLHAEPEIFQSGSGFVHTEISPGQRVRYTLCPKSEISDPVTITLHSTTVTSEAV